jgi:hypothetical protein
MFNTEYRHIFDPNRSLTLRYLKFRHCLEWYSFLTGLSFQATYLRIGKEIGFDESQKPNEVQLLEAAKFLHQERSNFLQKRAAFLKRRKCLKLEGKRQISKVELEMLYHPDWFEPITKKIVKVENCKRD